MKRMKVFAMLVILLVINCYCKEKPIETLPFVSKLYPTETNKSETELEKQYVNYINKCKIIGVEVVESLKDYIFYLRININAINEFYKAGIDLKKTFSREFYDGNTKDNSERLTLTSQIIVYGVITDYAKLEKKKGLKKASIKIIEMLKGDFYFKEVPQFFYWYVGDTYMYEYAGKELGKVEFFVGDKILLFVDKNGIEHELGSSDSLYSYNKGYNIYSKNETHDRGIREYFIERNRQFISRDLIYNGDHNYIYEGKVDSVLQVVRKIENINDTKNFYNRSYR